MIIEREVTTHYSQPNLLDIIHGYLKAAGRLEQPAAEDLIQFDQFHSGGHRATADVASSLMLRSGLDVLDIGCGIGGPARYFAGRYGCRVTGVDLTPDFVAVADSLTRLVGLAQLARFVTASATALPFAAASFDRVVMLHVGMNIDDKAAMAREAHRVLRSGGLLVIYDMMRTGSGEITFPLPWASRPEGSFLEAPDVYRAALNAAGFKVELETNRLPIALVWLDEVQRETAASEVAKLGPNLLLGSDAPAKRANIAALLRASVVSPLEMVARKA